MAARRLLVVMLILLGISTLAAAFIPTRPSGEGTTGSGTTEETEPPPPDRLPEGDLLPAEIEVRKGEVLRLRSVRLGLPDGSERERPIRVGDQLEIEVRCKCRDLVEIPALGLFESVAPATPALFNVLAQDPGSFGIRLVEADRVVARIEVAKPKSNPDD